MITIWVYLLKREDEAFDALTYFHVFVTIEFDRKLKCLCTNNGSEFTSLEFGRFYELTWYKEGGYNAMQLNMGCLNDVIGHCARGHNACCPQLISLVDCGERLLLLRQYIKCNRFP